MLLSNIAKSWRNGWLVGTIASYGIHRELPKMGDERLQMILSLRRFSLPLIIDILFSFFFTDLSDADSEAREGDRARCERSRVSQN